jgi:anti-sigma-K factor RskA
MTSSGNGNVHALVGAYAVDALDDAERTAFEAHLATCADCRAEVASLGDAAALLTGLSATTPPAGLRDRVLADAARTRPLPPEVPDTEPAEPATVRSLPGRRLTILAVAAAVLAVVGVGVGVTQPWRDDSSGQDLFATGRVLQAPDAESVTVELDGGAEATVTRSVKEGRAVIVTHAMPAAPAGKVYQLWLQTPSEEMVSAGLMPPGSDQTRLLEGDAADAIAVGITVEPAGGSAEPTPPTIALFDLTAAT